MPPLLSLKTGSRRSSASPRESKDFSFNDVSDQDDMDTDKYSPSSRPLSVAIPKTFTSEGPFCPRRPNLSDILSNTSPPPWTLSAFMAYLSQNHCLETLEFIMDAARYRKHYQKMAKRSEGGEIAPGSDESTYMQGLWERLMHAYIAPNGTREVNLPSNVRDSLLSEKDPLLPPAPDSLNTAVDKVHELMEESVLVPFLNSFYPQTAQPGSNGSSTEDLNFAAHSYDDRGLYRSRTGRRTQNVLRRHSPVSAGSPPSVPLSSSTPNSSMSPPFPMPAHSATQNRASAPSSISQFARSLSHRNHGMPLSSSPQSPPTTLSTFPARQSQFSMPTSEPFNVVNALSPSSSADTPMGNAPEEFSPPPLTALTDEASSPSAVATEPMTPPTTPPTCDTTVSTLSHSPPASAGGWGGSRGNPFKRMRYSFGWKRRHEGEAVQSPNGEPHS